MNIFNKIFLVIFFFFNLTLLNANANYVYVDMDLLVNSSDAGKYISSEISKIHKKKIELLKKIEEELKKGETEVINQKNVISKEEFDKKLSELRIKAQDYQKQRNNNAKSLSQKRIKATDNLLNIIQPILTEFANVNSISIIFQKKGIVMGKTDLDITNQILDILNKKHKKIDLN
jgi:outer membrane protein